MNKKARQGFLADFERWYTLLFDSCASFAGQERSVYLFMLFSRFLFLYFIQRKGLLENNQRYLHEKFEQCRSSGIAYHQFLRWLLLAIDTPHQQRQAHDILGNVPYLRLFPAVPLSERNDITIPDEPFQVMLDELQRFLWSLDEEEEEKREEVTPAILGYLVEAFIALQSPYARKKTGSFYTPEVICTFMTKSACYPVIQQRFEKLTGRQPAEEIPVGQEEESLDHLLETIDAREAGLLLFVILPTMSILDPAVGAANFLITALGKMAHVYEVIFKRIEREPAMQQPALLHVLHTAEASQGGRGYFIQRRVLERNLFGVDILQAPLDIARMRLLLSLLNTMPNEASGEPLPQLAFSLPCGNSLIGLDRITEKERLLLAQYPRYDACVAERKRLIALYCRLISDKSQSALIYDRIQACRDEAYGYLNRILLEKVATGKKGRKKEVMTLQDLEGLQPFHWCYDFSDIMHGPWWVRCDPLEAQIIEVNGQARGVRFGPGPR